MELWPPYTGDQGRRPWASDAWIEIWRWQRTLVLLPAKSHGQRSLADKGVRHDLATKQWRQCAARRSRSAEIRGRAFQELRTARMEGRGPPSRGENLLLPPSMADEAVSDAGVEGSRRPAASRQTRAPSRLRGEPRLLGTLPLSSSLYLGLPGTTFLFF